MKKTFKMRELDCANCAAKMETAIGKLEGVNACTISFMSQKMTLEADEAAFDGILKEAVKVVKKIEPDCEIVL